MKSSLVNRLVKRAALAVVIAVSGSLLVGSALADVGVGVDIHIGDAPPPRDVVIVREPVVYETYVVGYRRDLYDADLRLRLARADEWEAHEELAAARRHEGEIAVLLDEQEAIIGDLRRRADREGDAAALHGRAAETAELCADLHRRLDALQHRVSAGKEDYEACRVLGERAAMEDASERIRSNERKIALTSDELHDAEGRLSRLREEEAAEGGRARLHDAEARTEELRHDLDVAHDGVYNCQHRLTAAQDGVCLALHDRDEALWLLHRDDILAGRFELERCGFHIDLAIWGGRMPRDPEVIHAYCVHDVTYWHSNPVLIEERVVQVEKVTEVTKIREIQRVREVEKIRTVEKVETVAKPEVRRQRAQAAVVERKRFEAETTERKTAAAEGRKPRPVYIEKPAKASSAPNPTKVEGNAREEAHQRAVAREAAKNAAEAKLKADARKPGEASKTTRDGQASTDDAPRR